MANSDETPVESKPDETPVESKPDAPPVDKKPDETLLDTWTNRAKNRPSVAAVIFFYFLVSGVVQGVELAQKVWGWFHPPPDTSNVFVDCRIGLMPSVMPAEGRIQVMLTQQTPKENGGGGFAEYFGQPGSAIKWSNDKAPEWVYRCEMTNNSPGPLLNLSFAIRTVFRQPERVPDNPHSAREGSVTLDREWPVTIPKIDVGKPFVFYIWNCCIQKFVYVSLPPTVTTEGGRTIPLVQATNHLFQSLMPVPWPDETAH